MKSGFTIIVLTVDIHNLQIIYEMWTNEEIDWFILRRTHVMARQVTQTKACSSDCVGVQS